MPNVLKRTALERADDGQRLLLHVSLKVGFTLTSVDDGTRHTVKAYGEGLDVSDKATAKAMSAAYKSAIVQTFCIPIAGTEDADRWSFQAVASSHSPEPVQGWEQWICDIEDIVSVCETATAIELVQERNRRLLIALSRERPELYQQLGECFGTRREEISSRAARQPRKNRPQARSRKVALPEKQNA